MSARERASERGNARAVVWRAQSKALDSILQRAILIYPGRVYSIDVTMNATVYTYKFHKIHGTSAEDTAH